MKTSSVSKYAAREPWAKYEWTEPAKASAMPSAIGRSRCSMRWRSARQAERKKTVPPTATASAPRPRFRAVKSGKIGPPVAGPRRGGWRRSSSSSRSPRRRPGARAGRATPRRRASRAARRGSRSARRRRRTCAGRSSVRTTMSTRPSAGLTSIAFAARGSREELLDEPDAPDAVQPLHVEREARRSPRDARTRASTSSSHLRVAATGARFRHRNAARAAQLVVPVQALVVQQVVDRGAARAAELTLYTHGHGEPAVQARAARLRTARDDRPPRAGSARALGAVHRQHGARCGAHDLLGDAARAGPARGRGARACP